MIRAMFNPEAPGEVLGERTEGISGRRTANERLITRACTLVLTLEDEVVRWQPGSATIEMGRLA